MLRQIGERLPDVLARRSAAYFSGIALDLVGEIGHARVRQPTFLLGRVDERRCPLVKLIAVFGVALDTGNDKQVGVLCRGWPREEAHGQNRGGERRKEPTTVD